ncbi:hypothetical protein LUZ61_005438 [Rhynchospora tenuis]|uniref:ABC transporter domain-containing protein n=1 Tax=Rhynchospora tenuis TaxID=198213 RepID=A0AAD5ZPU5_9POAL|nr:hypothetical protein LUZ61_005438 [Rhynchospora tenuis]
MPSNADDNGSPKPSIFSSISSSNCTSKMDCFISSSCQPITLQFIDITYRVKPDPSTTAASASKSSLKRIFNSDHSTPPNSPADRMILSGVTGVASPGEILAIMGPSGSGKSTLLSILAGRSHHSAGSLLLNNNPFTKQTLRKTGFVTQDDILYPHLTVRETLQFCALLRLPAAAPKDAKLAAAEAVMSELGLLTCADTIIGNTFIRGVSGGERKRVSIAHELLINPSLLILDEPTSGLDSTAAARLVGTLAELARKNRTVIMSVHQPSSRVYQMFNSVLLLADGQGLYFGPGRDAMGYFGSIGFTPQFSMNPADFMLDLANGFAQEDYKGESNSNVKAKLTQSYKLVLVPQARSSVSATALADSAQIGRLKLAPTATATVGWFSQFKILLRRSLKERRHETFNSFRVFQVFSAAILSGLMWYHSRIHNVQDRLGLLFFISIFWGVFASFNSVFTFPTERAMLIKECKSGMYSLSSYYCSRMAGDLPMELILPTVFLLVLYWMSGLRSDLVSFGLSLLVLLGYCLVAQGLGLFVGAAVMDAKKASTLVTVIMLAFLLTGGFYVTHVPNWMNWVKYTSFTYYCFRLLILVQYRGHAVLIREFQLGEASLELCVGALLGMFVGYRLLAYLALRRIKA